MAHQKMATSTKLIPYVIQLNFNIKGGEKEVKP